MEDNNDMIRNLAKNLAENNGVLSGLALYWDAIGVEYGEYADDENTQAAEYENMTTAQKFEAVRAELASR